MTAQELEIQLLSLTLAQKVEAIRILTQGKGKLIYSLKVSVQYKV
jgi:hypothetical protein